MTFDVYKRYYAADCVYNEVERKGAVVTLTVTSEGGEVKYEYTLSFFPHTDPEDFGISYDAYASRQIYAAKGRRSKKREAAYLGMLRQEIDKLAESLGGTVDWDNPLGPEVFG